MPTIELTVTGKVQGVFYRASTQEKARELALTGWVKNLPDGRVQLRASGRPEALQQLMAWCAKGPSGARVDEVMRQDLPEEVFEDFRVIRS